MAENCLCILILILLFLEFLIDSEHGFASNDLERWTQDELN